MSDTYRFKRHELRAELFKACCALINPRLIAEYTYEFIVKPLDDFLSEHEVKGVDDEADLRLIDANALKPKINTFCWETINEMPTIKTKEIKYYDEDDSVWKIGRVIVDV